MQFTEFETLPPDIKNKLDKALTAEAREFLFEEGYPLEILEKNSYSRQEALPAIATLIQNNSARSLLAACFISGYKTPEQLFIYARDNGLLEQYFLCAVILGNEKALNLLRDSEELSIKNNLASWILKDNFRVIELAFANNKEHLLAERIKEHNSNFVNAMFELLREYEDNAAQRIESLGQHLNTSPERKRVFLDALKLLNPDAVETYQSKEQKQKDEAQPAAQTVQTAETANAAPQANAAATASGWNKKNMAVLQKKRTASRESTNHNQPRQPGDPIDIDWQIMRAEDSLNKIQERHPTLNDPSPRHQSIAISTTVNLRQTANEPTETLTDSSQRRQIAQSSVSLPSLPSESSFIDSSMKFLKGHKAIALFLLLTGVGAIAIGILCLAYLIKHHGEEDLFEANRPVGRSMK